MSTPTARTNLTAEMPTEPSAVMATGERTAEARALLTATAAVARRSWMIATVAEVVATALVLAQWAAVAWVIASALSGDAGAAIRAAILVGIFALAAAGVSWAARSTAVRGGELVGTSLRMRLLDALLPDDVLAPSPVVASAAGTALLEHVDDVVDHVKATEPARRSAPASMILVLVVVAVVHWPVAVLLAAATLLVPANMRLAGLASLEASRHRLRELDRLSAMAYEALRGAPVLRSLGAMGRSRAHLKSVSTRLGDASMHVLHRAFLSSLVMDVVVTFAIAVCASYVGLVLLGYVHLPFAPSLDLFAGTLVLLACPQYFAPLRRVAMGYHSRDRAAAAAEALLPVLCISDASVPATSVPDASVGSASARIQVASVASVNLAPRSSPVEVRTAALTHRSTSESEPLFSDLDLTAAAGCWTVLTGASGTGKTSLLRLLAGAREPTSGTISWIDPATGDSAPPSLRAATWLGQQTVIIDGTIAENIRLGCADASAEALREAAARAGLERLLARMPQGLETFIGDGGAGVSAGESRRIAIARALVHDAPIWFLDEPTAHLDPESERTVLTALAAATEGRTVIAATHSAQLVARADAEWRFGRESRGVNVV